MEKMQNVGTKSAFTPIVYLSFYWKCAKIYLYFEKKWEKLGKNEILKSYI